MSSNASYVLAQKEKLLQGLSKEGQASAGKLTARERIEGIIDEATFVEIDVFLKSRANAFNAEVPCEGLIAGFATIGGRPVYIYSQDYTVMSGSVGEMNGKKICKVMDMAAQNGVPVIGLLDSAGARVGEGVQALNAFAEIFNMSANIKGIVPQISLVLGPCIGASAIAARISDVVLGVEGISSLGAYSAYVYDAIEGKENSSDICSATYCAQVSGLVDVLYSNEKECFAGLKSLLDYLPSSCCDAPTYESQDDLNREIPDFDAFMESEYDVMDVVSKIVDNNASYELNATFAPSMVTAFARVNGKTIGVVANQAKECDGYMEISGIVKASEFIDKCDFMGIPILTLVDTKGLCQCTCNEEQGIVFESSKLVQAYARASVPMVSLILNNAIGSGYAMMASKALGVDMVYSWPSAVIGAIAPSAGAQMVYAQEITAAENPAQARLDYTAKFQQYNANAINAAQSGLIDDIIDPISTRPILVAAFEMLGFSHKCSC